MTRKLFAKLLFDEMAINEDVYLITGDLGYGLWDQIKDTYSDRFFNVGSSEMAMMGMGVGLAMEGKIPYVYSITPFAIYRPFEMVRNYVNYENTPIKLVGTGRDKDYAYNGFTHWAEDDLEILAPFKNIVKYKPDVLTKELMHEFIYNDKPSYLNVKRN
jgi:transketolase